MHQARSFLCPGCRSEERLTLPACCPSFHLLDEAHLLLCPHNSLHSLARLLRHIHNCCWSHPPWPAGGCVEMQPFRIRILARILVTVAWATGVSTLAGTDQRVGAATLGIGGFILIYATFPWLVPIVWVPVLTAPISGDSVPETKVDRKRRHEPVRRDVQDDLGEIERGKRVKALRHALARLEAGDDGEVDVVLRSFSWRRKSGSGPFKLCPERPDPCASLFFLRFSLTWDLRAGSEAGIPP